MCKFKWNPEKNRQLIKERGISFDEVVQAIADGYAVNDAPHWNKGKYLNQRTLIVIIRNYAHLVPYVIDGEHYFLKTIIPSRKNRNDCEVRKMTEKKTKNNLDAYEQEILDKYESGRMEKGPVSGLLVVVAQVTMRKNKNINIRISENDLESIKLQAAKEGLPYQTLIGSLIHKYATGSLKEVR